MINKTKSGDGERVAMLGYVPQYEIAAGIIYKALVNGTFEWAKVADPEAGSLDDIQVATTGRLDAYQVKWAEFTGTISFNDLIRDSNSKEIEKPSLYKQLSEGWNNFKKIYPERKVIVHLVHKLLPSSNASAKLPISEPPPKHPHFQSFLKDCWLDRTWCDKGLTAAPAVWKSALSKLKDISGFDDASFLDFIQSCELEFNYRLLGDATIKNQLEIREKADIDQIYILLTKMAGGEKRLIKLSKDELLEKLSWDHRFKYKFVHEFPITKTYQELTETVDKISTLLSKQNKGYLALLGAPGSGKSTTLTNTLKYRQGYKLIRYYAFVPDSTYQGRGESNSFLHDVTLSLKNFGFLGNKGAQPQSREEYLHLFGQQLVQANEKWVNDGVTTIIMIDGLDHIQREQNPSHSLLADLPHPNTIPEGVIFILGSQTLKLDNLSEAISLHLEKNERIIDISPLGRKQAHKIIDMWPNCSHLDIDYKKVIYKKSGGHPLSLVYFLQLVSENSEQVLLEEYPSYQGNIEENYSIYWQSIEENSSLCDLMALLSRIRGQINVNSLEYWTDYSTVKQLISSASHFFKKDNESSWRFFHNSFRQFVLDKTSRNLFGNFDENKNLVHHQKLAKICAGEKLNSPMLFEQLFHLYKSRGYKQVLEIGQQSYFREQFFNLRPIENIVEDINYVLLSAKEVFEPMPVIRSFLIEHELNERAETLNQIDLLNLILNSKGIEFVMVYIFDTNLLRIDELEALSFALKLAKNGYFNQAKRIFDAAEPLDYLSGASGVSSHSLGAKLLSSWVKIAHYFLPIEKIINNIFQTHFDHSDNQFKTIKDEDLHNKLIDKLADSILRSKNEVNIQEIFSYLSSNIKFHDNLINLSKSICLVQLTTPTHENAFEVITAWYEKEKDDLSSSEILLVAEIKYRHKHDLENIFQLIKGIEQPKLYKFNGGGKWKYLSPFMYRIRLNRLLTALGSETPLGQAVPSETKPKYAGNVLFERCLVSFSNIWGKAWKSESVTPLHVENEIKVAFRLFNKTYKETKKWIGWYEIESAAIDFFKFAVLATSKHGKEYVNKLAEIFEFEWGNKYWPTNRRREIIFALHEQGVSKEYVLRNLKIVEEQIADLEDIHTKATEYSELAFIWNKVGNRGNSQKLLPKILQGTFGIYHRKDRQFSEWVSWLGDVVSVSGENAHEEIEKFSAALLFLEQSGNGRGTQEAGKDLISITAKMDLGYGLDLMQQLFDQGALNYCPGITGYIQGALNRPSPKMDDIVNITSNLIIPFEEYNPSSLPHELTYNLFIKSANEQQNLDNLLSSINIHGLPSNRSEWIEGISQGMTRAGKGNKYFSNMALNTSQKGHSQSENPAITLKNGTELTNEEAQLKAYSIESLFQLLELIEKTNYCRWASLLKPFIQKMDLAQVNKLVTLLNPHQVSQEVNLMIAGAYFQNNEVSKAESIIEEEMGKSDAKGWDLNWDGGSRQKLFKLLVQRDKDKWRPIALRSLVDDYIGEYRYSSNMVLNLKYFFELFFEKNSLLKLWTEIKSHIYELDVFTESEKLPTINSSAPAQQENLNHLVTLSFYVLDLIIPELAEKAHLTIISLSKTPSNLSTIFDEINKRLAEVGLSQVKAMSLLFNLTKLHPHCTAMFESAISKLTQSPDFSVRIMALELASSLNIKPEPIQSNHPKLPFIYQLELPKFINKEEAISYSSLRPGDTLPDIDDPIELIRPFSTEFELISKISGIPFENILHRAKDFMFSLSSEDKWNRQAEESFRNWMDGVNLKFTYPRLRPQIAKLAMSYIISELVDAGYLPHDETLLATIVLRTDNKLLNLMPQSRPDYIIIPNLEESELNSDRKEWIEKIDINSPYFVTDNEVGRCVLGELSKWVWLDWAVPTEIRMTMICSPDYSAQYEVEGPSSFFPHSLYWNSEDYPHNLYDNPHSLVIYGSGSYIDHGNSKWIALNPHIGISLGWSVSEDGLFRWVNNVGDVMVESFCWKDGPINRHPPKMDDICSEGWLVLASPEAEQAIRKHVHSAIKKCSVVREVKDGSSLALNTAEKQTKW